MKNKEYERLLLLNKLIKTTDDQEELDFINQMIDKINIDSLIKKNISYSKHDLHWATVSLNKIIYQLLRDYDVDRWWDTNTLEPLKNENKYKELVILLKQTYEKKESKIYKTALEVVRLHAEKELIKLIKKTQLL